MGTEFSNMPVSLSGLLFRHLDRMSHTLSAGMGINQNINLLTSYYSLTIHLEAIMIPHLDEEYFNKKRQLEYKMPPIKDTMGSLRQNVEFLRWCGEWLQVLVAYAYKKRLMYIQTQEWTEVSDFDTSEDEVFD